MAKKTAKTKAKTSRTAKKKTVKKKTVKKAAKPSAKKTVKKAARKTAAKKAPKKAVKKAVKKKKLSLREKKILEIRQKLIDQKNALLAEAETAMNVLPDQTVFPDLGDQASVETDRNFMLRLKGREQRLLLKIDEAVERIDSGNYGICESCGEDIHIKRLMARPVTTMCIDCKTEQEEDEKLQAS
jgi:DnaK suppressor protein